MKKIFKISAALMAGCVFATSLNAVVFADTESKTKDILLYEDFENIDYKAFGNGIEDGAYIGGVGSATTQYVKAQRQTSGTLTGVADSKGNKMMNLRVGSIGTSCNIAGGQWCTAIFQFNDLNGDEAYDSWAFDAENLDNELVLSYDVSLSAKDWHTVSGSHDVRFYGGPGSFFNPVNEGGIFGVYTTDEEPSKEKVRFGIRTTMGADWTNANNIRATDVEYDERVNVTYKFKKDGNYQVYVSHGNNTATSQVLTTTLEKIDKIQFRIDNGHALNIDDVRAYTVPTDATLAVTSANKTNVGLTDKLDVTVNGYIPEKELSKVVVRNGDDVIDASQYTISVADNSSAVASTISVKFNEKMSFGTTYSVVIPTTVKDEAQDSLAEEAVVNFTTIDAPSFDIALTATVGGQNVTQLADAAGKSVACELDVTHTTTRNSSGVIFVGLYDADGNVVAYSASDKAYTPNEKDKIKVNLNVPKDTTGMKIKAFGCESLTKIDNIFSSVVTLQ